MGDVIKMAPKDVGDAFVYDTQEVLDSAKDRFTHLVLIGADKETGQVHVLMTHNLPESLWLLERGRQTILDE